VLISAADFVQAQRVRRVGQHALQRLFEEVDVVITPTAATGALAYDKSDQLVDIDKLVSLLFTPYWNAAGNPALALPMGLTAAGLPLSLQIAGRPFEEPVVFKVADSYQRVTQWHLQMPPVQVAAA
jgi:aspartyl-tRNA(Asn)/glutamyl-tRNA(Gln) amidotransferase subunit A